MSTEQKPKFEESLAELESVVDQIDSGELSLEDAITAFERGVGLVRTLNHQLDEIERRVEVLTRGASGELTTTPYQGANQPADSGEDMGDDDDFSS